MGLGIVMDRSGLLDPCSMVISYNHFAWEVF